jgi:hypothetical protein
VTLGVAGKARVQSEFDSLQIAKPLLDMFSGALSSSSGKI